MNHAELLKRSLPPVAYDPNAPLLSAELEAEGKALDAAQIAADLILTEADPRTTYHLLPDWERVLGLPDPCASPLATVQQRQAAVVAKNTKREGQSRPLFIDIAAKYSYPGATIDEFRPMTCNDTCNDALYSEDDRFVWRINLPSTGGIFLANCNSPCDEPLASWGDAAIECAIKRDKPAHTTALFAYV